jgi:GAF domain-containing protein
MDGHAFDRQLAVAIRALDAEPDPPHTLQRLVEVTPEFFRSADYAGVSLVEGGQITTPAATNERLRALDEVQYRMGEGPCNEAVLRSDVVTVDDLARDQRWPRWGALMTAELGVRSSLSFRLFTAQNSSWGALNVYSHTPHAFDADDVAHGQTIAAMVGVVLARSIHEDQLAAALEMRAVIGQATGILMERFQLDADVCFNILRRLSQQNNVKLRDIAVRLVETRRLPGREDVPPAV